MREWLEESNNAMVKCINKDQEMCNQDLELRKQDLELRKEQIEFERQKLELEEGECKASSAMMLALAQTLLKKFGD
jgi:hypothetical protein